MDQDKYLGDLISSTLYGEEGSNNRNIKKRVSTGLGINSQIMTIIHIDASFRIGPCGISAQLRAEAQNDLRKSHDMLRKCTDRAEFPHH